MRPLRVLITGIIELLFVYLFVQCLFFLPNWELRLCEAHTCLVLSWPSRHVAWQRGCSLKVWETSQHISLGRKEPVSRSFSALALVSLPRTFLRGASSLL